MPDRGERFGRGGYDIAHFEPDTDTRAIVVNTAGKKTGTCQEVAISVEDLLDNSVGQDIANYKLSSSTWKLPVFFHNLRGFDDHIFPIRQI